MHDIVWNAKKLQPRGNATPAKNMKTHKRSIVNAADVDFRRGVRGAVRPNAGKTRITIYVDSDVLDAFRARAEAEGRGYQTAMNDALRAAVIEDGTTLEGRIRRIVREELGAHSKRK